MFSLLLLSSSPLARFSLNLCSLPSLSLIESALPRVIVLTRNHVAKQWSFSTNNSSLRVSQLSNRQTIVSQKLPREPSSPFQTAAFIRDSHSFALETPKLQQRPSWLEETRRGNTKGRQEAPSQWIHFIIAIRPARRPTVVGAAATIPESKMNEVIAADLQVCRSSFIHVASVLSFYILCSVTHGCAKVVSAVAVAPGPPPRSTDMNREEGDAVAMNMLALETAMIVLAE